MIGARWRIRRARWLGVSEHLWQRPSFEWESPVRALPHRLRRWLRVGSAALAVGLGPWPSSVLADVELHGGQARISATSERNCRVFAYVANWQKLEAPCSPLPKRPDPAKNEQLCSVPSAA